MAIANKFPGKDISIEDIKTKFPLVAKKNKQHKSKFKVSGVEFGSKLIPVFSLPFSVTKSINFFISLNVAFFLFTKKLQCLSEICASCLNFHCFM